MKMRGWLGLGLSLTVLMGSPVAAQSGKRAADPAVGAKATPRKSDRGSLLDRRFAEPAKGASDHARVPPKPVRVAPKAEKAFVPKPIPPVQLPSQNLEVVEPALDSARNLAFPGLQPPITVTSGSYSGTGFNNALGGGTAVGGSEASSTGVVGYGGPVGSIAPEGALGSVPAGRQVGSVTYGGPLGASATGLGVVADNGTTSSVPRDPLGSVSDNMYLNNAAYGGPLATVFDASPVGVVSNPNVLGAASYGGSMNTVGYGGSFGSVFDGGPASGAGFGGSLTGFGGADMGTIDGGFPSIMGFDPVQSLGVVGGYMMPW